MRIREIVQTRVRYGYRKIRVRLNGEGWKVGKYLVERIYREEGLTLISGGNADVEWLSIVANAFTLPGRTKCGRWILWRTNWPTEEDFVR